MLNKHLWEHAGLSFTGSQSNNASITTAVLNHLTLKDHFMCLGHGPTINELVILAHYGL